MVASLIVALALTVSSTGEAPHEAPFDLSSGRPVVEILINGEGPFPFIFDTGAHGAMIRTSLVEELGLQPTGRQSVTSPAGGDPIEVDATSLARIELAGAEALDVPSIIIDFGAPEQMASVGVIGPDIFSDYGRVAFDFSDNSVEIGGDLHHAETAAWQDFSATAPLIEIPLRIGEITLPVHIDTGNPSSLTFPADRIEELPLTGPVEIIGLARTIDRTMEVRGAPVAASAFIGDAEIPLTRVVTLPLPFANMGSATLRGLYLEIDWTENRVAVSGTAAPATPRRPRAPQDADE